MGKFVVLLRNKRKGGLTDDLLRQHVAHLRQLHQEAKLVLCGPFKNDAHAIQILNADSFKDAQALVQADPFVVDQYYTSYELYELIEANESNNWLLEDAQTSMNLRDRCRLTDKTPVLSKTGS